LRARRQRSGRIGDQCIHFQPLGICARHVNRFDFSLSQRETRARCYA
jgi:hypothetical protein